MLLENGPRTRRCKTIGIDEEEEVTNVSFVG
jgi:hypothetical protein